MCQNNTECTIEILPTEDCNNHCLYCIQGEHNKIYLTPEKTQNILKFIDKYILYNNENNSINRYKIVLFGGEPLLNFSSSNCILEYCLEKNINVAIITNGFLVEKYLDIFKKLDSNNLLSLQISYDGQPIHDLYRCNTSKKTIDAINLMKSNISNLNVKSTLPLDGFQFMFDCYKDVTKNLNLKYVPTIDYRYSQLSTDKIDYYIDILKRELIKIAKYCIDNNKNDPMTDLLEVNNNLICSAGCHYFAIDSNLNVSRCHSTAYSANDLTHIIGNISDIDINHKIDDMFKLHSIYSNFVNNECRNCDVTICKKCCAENFKVSDKKNYIDKWYDKNNNNLCKLYKAITKISVAYNYSILKKVKNDYR